MIFFIKKMRLLYRFKRLDSKFFLDSFNRILMTSLSSKYDHLIDLEDLDDNFILAYSQFQKNDKLDFIIKIIVMNYYLDLLIINGYEVKLINNQNISVFKKTRDKKLKCNDCFFIKENAELKNKYFNKIKAL